MREDFNEKPIWLHGVVTAGDIAAADDGLPKVKPGDEDTILGDITREIAAEEDEYNACDVIYQAMRRMRATSPPGPVTTESGAVFVNPDWFDRARQGGEVHPDGPDPR